MKKCLSITLTFLTLLFLCYCHMANRPHTASLPAPVSQPGISDGHIAPSASIEPLSRLHAAGACLMDAATGRILYGKEETTSLPMASTTKIMTCLLALENGTLDDMVTFSSRAASMPKVHLGASSGSSFRLEDLLYSLMLESHNDTAVAIAEHIGGSVEGFADMMNAKAAELGMSQTHFVTPNGLDADGHASTPADMCRLAAYACQNSSFLGIIATPNKTIRSQKGTSYSLSNKDAFLTSYEGALGIKTGFTGKAGFCFVGAARRDERTFVSCVLASGWPPNKSYKWTDTKALMNFGFKHYAYQNIPVQDLSQIQIPVEEGKAVSTGISTPVVSPILLSPFDTVDIRYQLPISLTAPVKKDTSVGSVDIYVNEALWGSYPVYPLSETEEMTFWDLVKENVELFLEF